MLAKYEAINNNDSNGNPTGGSVKGTGLSINWQDGPLGRGADRKEPNGAFVETVIDSCSKRLKFYQDSRFACEENHRAIILLDLALSILDDRTRSREARKVEGTHAV